MTNGDTFSGKLVVDPYLVKGKGQGKEARFVNGLCHWSLKSFCPNLFTPY